jgi:hypothetical protein
MSLFRLSESGLASESATGVVSAASVGGESTTVTERTQISTAGNEATKVPRCFFFFLSKRSQRNDLNQ